MVSSPAFVAAAAALILLGAVASALALRRGQVPNSPRATFVAHAEELRSRLLRVVAVALVALVATLSFRIALQPFSLAGQTWIVPLPIPDLYDNMAAQLFRAVAAHVVPSGVQLIATSPMDGFGAQFTMALGLAAAAALPIFILEMGRFFGPALGSRGRRWLVRIVVPSTALFLLGAIFCYAVVLPFTMAALYKFGDTLGATNLLQVRDLAGLCLSFMFGFGVAFETPLVMLGLAKSGLVPAQVYLRKWRIAILVIVVAAAVLTPDPTVVSQAMLAVPLLVLYFGGALLALRLAPSDAGR